MTLYQTYLSLATYCYRRAVFYAAADCEDQCDKMLSAARYHDDNARRAAS
jgi:hypothetical protein